MKKIFSLSITALMIIGLVIGGTWAYFSDTETSIDNVIEAGTLDLGLSATEALPGVLPTGGLTTGVSTPAAWAPGQTSKIVIYINNSGSIAMAEVTMELELGDFTDGNAGGALDNVTGITGTNDPTDIFAKMVKITAIEFGGVSVGDLVGKTLYELDNSGSPEVIGDLAAGAEKKLEITLTFNADATNGCQGDAYDFDLTFVGNQVATP